MGILKEKYVALAPTLSYLSDIVVLAQAWKKSHAYIRRHNWFQNTLELDCSAIDLESNLTKWAGTLKRGSYRTAPLRLVPAPKSSLWGFENGWSPQEKDEQKRVLRPLAHLGIREQTISTAVMLCLADCVETAQGDSELDAEGARSAGVFSYGNRLFCRWSGLPASRRARFSWGNSDVYSRYFQDYKNFVNRPTEIVQGMARSDEAGRIFVVKIDLSAFFDNIDIGALVKALKREYSSFRKRNADSLAADAEFWVQARAALEFSWDERDKPLAALLRGRELPRGLPQGMVSAGFFANAYLLAFDRMVGRAVQRRSSIGLGKKIAVHDYCRYVDDIRLVVRVSDPNINEISIASTVSTWIQSALDRSIDSEVSLKVNPDKTEVEAFSAIGGSSGVVARMNTMQKDLSGPFDMSTLTHVEAGLQGLLSLAELGLQAKDSNSSALRLELGSIASPKLEVRDDTLTRFSAYRLTKSLRLRRAMTDLSERTDGGTARDSLQHEFEVSARRLIAAWAVNPSLVQVLAFGLDLFPSPEILKPVISALMEKLGEEVSEFERRVAWYVLSELYRSGATETGRKAHRTEEFKVGDINGYRSCLADTAIGLLGRESTPWYLRQQLLLFLCVYGSPPEISSRSSEVQLHLLFVDYLHGDYTHGAALENEALSVALVGFQISGDAKHFAGWLRTYLKGLAKKDVSKALEIVGQTDTDLFATITKRGHGKGAARSGILPKYLGQYVDSRWDSKSGPLPTDEWIPLSKIITHPENPVSQENALLWLLSRLLVVIREGGFNPEKISPLTVELRASDWGTVADPRSCSVEVRYRPGTLGIDPRYATPPWCARKFAWVYALGRIVRAAATSELDFTAGSWVMHQDVGWYHGIRSTWQKRRSGMSQSAFALGGTTSGVTQWLSELLVGMLAWPGVATDSDLVPGLDSVQRPIDLSRIVDARIAFQSALYAGGCGLPVYIHPVDWKVREPRNLRVAIVQGLMPQTGHFEDGMAGLEEPSFRAKHRNHLASVLHLAYTKVAVKDTVSGDDHRPRVDLVIAPEYSVHVADQDLMRGFSDSLGAMLFYGLVGMKHPVTGNYVNAARWLVPQHRGGKRSWVEVDQGKGNMTQAEKTHGIEAWRPYQAIIELRIDERTRFRIAGAICYDATDLALAADLRNISHMFVVPAMNKDVKTFDGMVAALRYHMYQHVLIANSGEYGGSTAQAPYEKEYARLIAHSHGVGQLSVSIFDVDIDHFGPLLTALTPEARPSVSHGSIGKTPPAGLNRA